MHIGKEQVQEEKQLLDRNSLPKLSSEEESSPQDTHNNPHLAFQKNYPKNIFIPMIEHLSERGLQKEYEECVGTRGSFQGKNVVSLAQIHRVMSQGWFSQGINLVALISSMSNKILMNSKIKKKLFHLLLIKELFTIPIEDAREFKKLVSKKASEVSESKLPDDHLFSFPSALIYLLHMFAQGLERAETSQYPLAFHQQFDKESDPKKPISVQEQSSDRKGKVRQASSKLQYKYYIGKIILYLNGFQGEHSQLLDLIQSIKSKIYQRECQLRQKYHLSQHVPQWSYFNSLVVNNCYLVKRNRNRLTYSLLNAWIQEFKDQTTSFKRLIDIVDIQVALPQRVFKFTPIVIIPPPS